MLRWLSIISININNRRIAWVSCVRSLLPWLLITCARRNVRICGPYVFFLTRSFLRIVSFQSFRRDTRLQFLAVDHLRVNSERSDTIKWLLVRSHICIEVPCRWRCFQSSILLVQMKFRPVDEGILTVIWWHRFLSNFADWKSAFTFFRLSVVLSYCVEPVAYLEWNG